MKRLLRWAIATSIVASAVLFLGNPQDRWLWIYVTVFAVIGLFAMFSMDEDLVRERLRPATPSADRLSLRTIRLLAVAHLILGIVDSRYGWTHVPGPLRAAGIAGFAVCFLAILRATWENRFFSSAVRVQAERGHRVVDTGPYAVIRHPGYAAMLPLMQFSGLALGSWIAFAVAFAYSALILRRVRFEDSFLRQNLEGYAAYTGRVRYRLIPRVW